jgi:hypothetical protein
MGHVCVVYNQAISLNYLTYSIMSRRNEYFICLFIYLFSLINCFLSVIADTDTLASHAVCISADIGECTLFIVLVPYRTPI